MNTLRQILDKKIRFFAFKWTWHRRDLELCCCWRHRGRFAVWTERRCLFVRPAVLPVMKQTPTGIPTVSPYSRSQGGREGPRLFGWAARLRSWPHAISHFRLSMFAVFVHFFLFAVLSPGRVGKHDSLDGLLWLLLRHLAHPPHRPRHAGPGKSNIWVTGRQRG